MTSPQMWCRLLAVAAGWLASSAHAQSACQNEFRPVQPGWVWTYRLTDSKGKVTSYTEETLLTAQGYTLLVQQPGQPPARHEVRCVGGNYVSQEPPSFGQGIQVTRAVFSGVALPAGRWQVGQSWKNGWQLEGKRGPLRGTGSLDYSNTVAALESVTVPAGKFEAWKVAAQQKVSGKVAGISVGPEAHNYTVWYASGVGVVKVDYGQGAKLELLSLTKK